MKNKETKYKKDTDTLTVSSMNEYFAGLAQHYSYCQTLGFFPEKMTKEEHIYSCSSCSFKIKLLIKKMYD